MRRALVVLALVAACKSKPDNKTAAPPAAKIAVPKIATASMLAADDGTPPPLLVIIDDPSPPKPDEHIYQMTARMTWAKSWAELATGKPLSRAISSDLDAVFKLAKEGHALRRTPEDTFKNAGKMELEPIPTAQGEDETGGTGTAMALEEGKMGKQDADRAERPKEAPPEPIGRGPVGGAFAKLAGPSEDGAPSRLADVAGEIVPDGKLRPQILGVIASPRTNAQRLAKVLTEFPAALVVEHAGTVRPLRIDFTPERDSVQVSREPQGWIEARVSAKRIVVEAVPDTPIEVKDGKELAAAVEKVRSSRKLDPNTPVDLLFDPELDAQKLVDMIVALEAAKVRIVGLGSARGKP